MWKYAFYTFENCWKRPVKELIFSKFASLQLLDDYFANFDKLNLQWAPFCDSFQNNLQGEVTSLLFWNQSNL